jgi:DNA (cytosine-5)-methyltransferase 1
MIYGSVCSGIEAASVAWHPLGWRAAFLSEIEPFPRAVLTRHYPDTPLHGDFTTIEKDAYAPIELLVGGTPCQSFSIAGLRRGMADERGNLALEYLRLADRLRPRWVLWENVSGVLSNNGGRDFGAFLGGLAELGYGFAYRVLDAQFFHLAQRRKRVFVVGCAGDWRRAAEVLFEPASLRGDSAPRRDAGTDAPCGTLGGTSPGGGWRIGADEAAAGQLIPDVATTLRSRDAKEGFGASEDGTGRGTPIAPVAFHGSQDPDVSGDVTHPCGRNQGQETCAMIDGGVRRLTPRECERLQGFEDDYTLIPWRNGLAADGPRYKALGNSMAVPVMRWIGQRIAAQDAEMMAAA